MPDLEVLWVLRLQPRGGPRAWLVVVLGVLLAAALRCSLAASGATRHAPTPGGDQEETDFYFAGVITFDDEPLQDVT